MTFPGHTASTCFPSCCLRSLPCVIQKVCVTLEDCKRQEAPLLTSSDGGLTTLLLEVLPQTVVYSKFPNRPTSTLFSRPWPSPGSYHTQWSHVWTGASTACPHQTHHLFPSLSPWAPFPHATHLLAKPPVSYSAMSSGDFGTLDPPPSPSDLGSPKTPHSGTNSVWLLLTIPTPSC